MKACSFKKKEHLKKNSLIGNVFDKGVTFRSRSVNIYILDTESKANRAAFLVRKNLYNKKSVLRNRFRRVLREAYRKTKYILPPGHDIVILAASFKKHTKSEVIEKELIDAFKKYIKK